MAIVMTSMMEVMMMLIIPSVHQTRPDQTRPDQTRQDQTRPDQTRPDLVDDSYDYDVIERIPTFVYSCISATSSDDNDDDDDVVVNFATKTTTTTTTTTTTSTTIPTRFKSTILVFEYQVSIRHHLSGTLGTCGVEERSRWRRTRKRRRRRRRRR